MTTKRYSTDVIDIEEARAERRRKRQEAATKKQKRLRKKEPGEAPEKKIKPKTKRGKIKVSRRRLLYFAVFLVLVSVIAVSSIQIFYLKAEQDKVEKEHAQTLKEKERLERELNYINDPGYVEEQARERLRMIKPGELLYVFPNAEKDFENRQE